MKKLLSILMLSMILFGCSNNKPPKTITKRVLVDELIDKGTQEISSFYYESELFNGITFDVYPNGKLSQEYTVKNGVIDGLYKTYYENGKLKQEGNYRNGQLVRTETNTKPVKIVPPKATEIKKMGEKEIISDIYIGKPIKSKQEDYRTAARIQLNDDFAEVVEIEVDKPKMITSIKADETVTMGIITDIKQELRKANALKINYSTRKGENGDDYQLGGRKANVKPKPKGNQVEGKVVVAITVNRLGDVIYANPGAKGSTTYNNQLLQRAKKAALETKFEPKQSAPTNQQGTIIYCFLLY